MKGYRDSQPVMFGLAPVPPATVPHLPTNWAELFTLVYAELDQQTRRIARQEHALLLAEQAAVVNEPRGGFLTVRQAAAALAMHPQTVYEWIKSGKLPAFKAGRAVRIAPEHVAAALQAHVQPDGRRKYARRASRTESGQRKPIGCAKK